MANVFDSKFIQSIFPDATEEQLQKLTSRHEQVLAKYETEAKKFETEISDLHSQVEISSKQVEEANAQIEDFRSLDVSSIKSMADEWKARAQDWKAKLEAIKKESEAKKLESEAKIAAVRYESAVKDKIGNLKFSSNSAKKAFLNDVLSSTLPYDDKGELMGFDDFVEQYKESDPDAFAKDVPQAPELPRGASMGQHQQNAGMFVDEVSRAFAAKGITFGVEEGII